jgi:diguanylate cyclase (GGDEF)-like protein
MVPARRTPSLVEDRFASSRSSTPARPPGLAELTVVREVTELLAREAPPLLTLRHILSTSAELGGGMKGWLFVPGKVLDVLFPDEADPGEIVPIDVNAELICREGAAEELSEAEGRHKAWTNEEATRLYMPTTGAGVLAVVHPGTFHDVTAEQYLALQLLADLANTVLAQTTERAVQLTKTHALESTRQQLEQQNQELRELAVVDELTGLPNRRFFQRRLDYEIDRCARYGRHLGLAIFDVDHFKRVNDGYGHPAGDAALQHLAAVSQETVRQADLVARIGGEEFALVMPETPRPGCLIAAERLRVAVAEAPLQWKETTLNLSISIGVVAVEAGWRGPAAELFERADQALYRAKNSGRNCVVMDDGTEG